ESRGVAEAAVAKLGAAVVLGDEPPPGQKKVGKDSPLKPVINAAKGLVMWIKEIDPVSEDEEATVEITKNIKVASERKSNVVSVSYDSDDPALSQAIVGAIIESHRERHADIHHNDESRGFFDQQRSELEQRVADASDALRSAKNKYGIASVDGQRTVLEGELLNLRQTKLRVLKDLTEAGAKQDALTDLAASEPLRKTAEERVIPNTGRDDLRSQLYALQVQRMELESTLARDHPKLIAIRTKEEEARREIRNDSSVERKEVTQSLNQVLESLTLSKAMAQANGAGFSAAMLSIETEESNLLQRIEELNRADIEIRRLERELRLAEKSFMSYAESLEDARVGDALNDSTISNVSVAQEPTYQEKPVNPSKLILALLGVSAMIFGTVAVVAGSEILREDTTAPDVEPQVAPKAPKAAKQDDLEVHELV
ncbi:MAG: hypothetical protein AAF483_23870, partial [Planctomycetota bacterium]